MRFAVGITVIQIGWIVRLLIGWSEVGYVTFLGLGLLMLGTSVLYGKLSPVLLREQNPAEPLEEET